MAGFGKKVKLEDCFGWNRSAAIVYPTGYPVGFGVARALAENGVKVIALDNNPASVARYSNKFAFYCEPGIKSSPDIVDFLKGFLKKFSVKPVLFLVDDEDILEVTRRFDEIKDYVYLATGGKTNIELIDKTRQYKIFQEKGIQMPRTLFFEAGLNAVRVGREIGYPCIIKPDISTSLRVSTGKKVLFCQSESDFEKNIKIADKYCNKYLIQEYIPGGNERLYTFGSYVSADRNTIVFFTGRKVRQFPPDFGTCRCGESVSFKELEEDGVRVLRDLGYSGISQLEFKHDPRDGKLKVMEINGRAWLWMSLAVECGVNIPLAAYYDSLGMKIPAYRQIGEKMIWINFFEDLLNSLHAYRACGYKEHAIGFGNWIRSIKGHKTYAFFSWDDPIPAVVRTFQFFRDYGKNIRKYQRKCADV
ncbi:MAG: hypothetical protein JW728_00845 [Candidatus Aureabacteria bacterium]|nr:hypothetical protein [Candidatus Auribacterota bacterium]